MYWSKGVFHMLLAVFFFSLMNVFVKMLGHIPAVEIVFFRALVSLVISVILLKIYKINFWGNNKKILILRGAAGMIGLIFYFKLDTINTARQCCNHFISRSHIHEYSRNFHCKRKSSSCTMAILSSFFHWNIAG